MTRETRGGSTLRFTMETTESHPPAPWTSLTPALSRRVVEALAAVAALPTLAILAYGWGAAFGAAWVLVLLLVAAESRRARHTRSVAGRVVLACVVLGSLVTLFSGPAPRDVVLALALAVCAGVVGGLIVLAWLDPARRCLELSWAPPARCFPTDDADAVLRCARGIAWVGAASCVVADEPLWPLTAGVLAVGVGLAVRTVRREARALAWLRAVAAGRVGSWTLRAVTDGSAGRAWLVPAGRESAYRGANAVDAVAQVGATSAEGSWRLVTPGERPSRATTLALHGAGLALCLVAAVVTHGYASDLLPSDRAAPGLRTLFPFSARPFVVDREPPAAVWARIPRHKTLRRMGQFRIPGVELWRDCKSGGCNGVTLAVDEQGRLLDVPAVMARLRDRPLIEQARMRYELLAGRGREAVLEARRCGRRVKVRLAHWGERRTELLDFDTGERARVTGSDGPLDCR